MNELHAVLTFNVTHISAWVVCMSIKEDTSVIFDFLSYYLINRWYKPGFVDYAYTAYIRSGWEEKVL